MMDTKKLYRMLADSHPSLQAGIVHCRTCGVELGVDSAKCLREGWPVCCGETMRLGKQP